MRYLYRQTARGHDMVQLVASMDEGIEKARHFVGEKTSDVDGCATGREESTNGTVFRCHRTTSFGQRRATVRPITDLTLTGLD